MFQNIMNIVVGITPKMTLTYDIEKSALLVEAFW